MRRIIDVLNEAIKKDPTTYGKIKIVLARTYMFADEPLSVSLDYDYLLSQLMRGCIVVVLVVEYTPEKMAIAEYEFAEIVERYLFPKAVGVLTRMLNIQQAVWGIEIGGMEASGEKLLGTVYISACPPHTYGSFNNGVASIGVNGA